MSAAKLSMAEVDGLYLSEYDKVVKPHQLFLIPNYFIRYWVNRLGTTQAWIVLSLQQACWRADEDQCAISQASIAEEIGIRRRTVGRILREHPMRHWYIPEISYQNGVVKNATYYPLPNKYQVYLSTPLIPEHMAGLYAYMQSTCPKGTAAEIALAVEHLLSLSPKAALAYLEQYAVTTKHVFDKPLSVQRIVEVALDKPLKVSTKMGKTTLGDLLSRLHTHLTNLGSTACRQYFRREWVSRLGTTEAWLVMILRSRCYYNMETDETRDICTWQKKDLAEQLGQSTRNLTNLLDTEYISHFVQILDQQKRTLTMRVAISEEPLTTETAESFWARQVGASNRKNCPITPVENRKNCPITAEDNAKECPTTSEETGRNVPSLEAEPEIMSHHSAPNTKKCPPFKDSKDSVLEDSRQKQEDFSLCDLWETVLEDIQLQVLPNIFSTWFFCTSLLAREKNTFTIAVKSEQAREWLEHQLKKVVQRTLKKHIDSLEEPIEITFVVQ
jgi:hypothetical protein